MIKKFDTYVNENIDLEYEPGDWKEHIKKSCFIPSVNYFYNVLCDGSEEMLLKYFDVLCVDKNVIVHKTNERFKGRSSFIKKFYNRNNDTTYISVGVVDDKGVEYILPATTRIDFILPKRKISKIDPYGEENWD